MEGDGVRRASGSRLSRLRWPLILLALSPVALLLDRAFVLLLNPDADHALDDVAAWLDLWSTRLMLAALFSAFFAAYAWDRLSRWRVPTAAFLAGWVLSQTTVTFLKHAVGRARPVHPEGLGEGLRPLFRHADTLGFPSGHAATSFLVAVVVSLWFPRAAVRAAVFGLAILVALGRSYIGAHYLSDILAGAGIGWFCAIVGWRLALLAEQRLVVAKPTGVVRIGYWTTAMLVMTWLAQTPRRIRTFVTEGEPIAMRVEVTDLAALTAPFRGLGEDLSSWPDLGDLMIDGAAWLGLVVVLLLVWLRRRAALVLVVLVPWAALQAWVAISGLAPGVRLRPAEPAHVADMQSHIGDPHDGTGTWAGGILHFRRMGIDALPTWHNRWSVAGSVDGSVMSVSGSGPVTGMEWSAGPPGDTDLHLLVYAKRVWVLDDGSIFDPAGRSMLEALENPVAIADVIPPPALADLGEERDWRRLIARAKEAGALVIASHPWRGEVEEVATYEELIAAGLDGFEIAGRHQEIDEKLLERQRRIEGLVFEHDLIALASSDFHGKRVAHHQIMACRVPAHPHTAIFTGDPITCGMLMRPFPPDAVPNLLRPPFVPLVYFTSMSTKERASWLLWTLVLTGAARLVAERWRDRDGSRAAGPRPPTPAG